MEFADEQRSGRSRFIPIADIDIANNSDEQPSLATSAYEREAVVTFMWRTSAGASNEDVLAREVIPVRSSRHWLSNADVPNVRNPAW